MNQTLKKLSENHYIIYKNVVPKKVEIYVYDDDYEKPLVYKTDEVFFEIGKEAFQITHSFGKELEGVDNRPLSEVEELLFGYSLNNIIEKHLENNHIEASPNRVKVIRSLIQEITKDKSFTIKDMKKAFQAGSDWQEGGTILYPDEHGFIQSLQPTEWKIKINEQNKLELV